METPARIEQVEKSQQELRVILVIDREEHLSRLDSEWSTRGNRRIP